MTQIDPRPARVSIQTQDFDLQREIEALHGTDARVGAVCSFVGTVRDRNDGSQVASMELEHYPGMTERAMLSRAVLPLASSWLSSS